MVRLHRPRAEVLNSGWQFPEAKPANLNVGFGVYSVEILCRTVELD